MKSINLQAMRDLGILERDERWATQGITFLHVEPL